jgi:hypothetical protein
LAECVDELERYKRAMTDARNRRYIANQIAHENETALPTQDTSTAKE